MQHPEPRPEWLVPRTDRSVYNTAIRITDITVPATVLQRLTRQLVSIAARLDALIRLYIEPNGDACDRGNWVDVGIRAGTVWAEMTPRPSRLGGAIPPQIDAELELAGWVAVTEGSDGDPYDHMSSLPAELAALEPAPANLEVVRRLVADLDDRNLHEWVDLVRHGVQRVIDPTARRWFLHAEVEVLDAGPLHDPPYAPTPVDGEWSIDLGRLLSPEQWERAVWAPDSEAGTICCDLGLHQYHEPPCPPAPLWGRHHDGGDADADMDL